jgi:sugar phosphate permease
MFFATFLVVWAFLIIGFIMQVAGKARTGALLITIGSLVFVPVGLVAIIGSIRVARRQGAPTASGHTL